MGWGAAVELTSSKGSRVEGQNLPLLGWAVSPLSALLVFRGQRSWQECTPRPINLYHPFLLARIPGLLFCDSQGMGVGGGDKVGLLPEAAQSSQTRVRASEVKRRGAETLS